ncbi:MAG: alpha/beta hydrolase [Isosphaeraceae bacterium]
MRRNRPIAVVLGCLVAVGAARALEGVAPCRADSIIMKSGIVYRSQGAPDRDNNTLVFIWDGLKRVVVRDSKIEKIEPDNALRTGERFQLNQPMTVHGGLMPHEVLSVHADPWDDLGRRSFRYEGSRLNRSIRMEQAIIEIGPHIVKYRGIDGFWLGQVETNQVPRKIVMALLGKVEQKNGAERERVIRFLMDVGWYAEAKTELDRLIRDFPQGDLKERAAGARAFIIQAEATQRRSEIELAKKALQFRRIASLLNSFKDKEIGTELLIEVRDIQRRFEQERDADRKLGLELRQLSGSLPSSARGFWREPLAEVLKALADAPDAVRERFAAWRKAKAASGTNDEAQFALAMSGYVVGHESAVPNLKEAETLWKARALVREYLVGKDPAGRSNQAAAIAALDWPVAMDSAQAIHDLELLTKIAQLMPPPRHVDGVETEKTITHSLIEDDNAEKTVYAVCLPPEYHPLRSYPALVVLHSGDGPEKAIDAWKAEAMRRGYILIAPQYCLAGQSPDYRYTPSEHAAVELALRDARKCYAIDSDRVYVAGQLTGANMAWDYGLAHPDLFAGVVVISGFPAKYVPRYLPHHEHLPLLVVLGDLAPASNEVVFNSYVKPLILKTWDVTYAEYLRRGLEEFPEEIPSAFDWMDRRRREAFPRAFEVVSARTGDDRFYGVVIREFGPGRVTAPEAVDILGQNLNPATIKMKSSKLSNLIMLDIKGIKRLDVWLSPKMIDFKRKPEIRINGRSLLRQTKVKPDVESMLEDLRLRGDRQQIYWYRFSAG